MIKNSRERNKNLHGKIATRVEYWLCDCIWGTDVSVCYNLLEICNLPRRTWLQITEIFFYCFPLLLKMFWVCLVHQKGMRLLFEVGLWECKGQWNSLVKELSNSKWLISLHQVHCVRTFCRAWLIPPCLLFVLWGYNFWQPTNYFDYFWRLKIKWQNQICCKPADILTDHARRSLGVHSQNLLEILKTTCITSDK